VTKEVFVCDLNWRVYTSSSASMRLEIFSPDLFLFHEESFFLPQWYLFPMVRASPAQSLRLRGEEIQFPGDERNEAVLIEVRLRVQIRVLSKGNTVAFDRHFGGNAGVIFNRSLTRRRKFFRVLPLFFISLDARDTRVTTSVN